MRYGIWMVFATTILLWTGCASNEAPKLRSDLYRRAYADGCATAKGEYTKNHDLFKNDPEYEEGWFAGRRECNPSSQR